MPAHSRSVSSYSARTARKRQQVQPSLIGRGWQSRPLELVEVGSRSAVNMLAACDVDLAGRHALPPREHRKLSSEGWATATPSAMLGVPLAPHKYQCLGLRQPACVRSAASRCASFRSQACFIGNEQQTTIRRQASRLGRFALQYLPRFSNSVRGNRPVAGRSTPSGLRFCAAGPWMTW